MVRIIKYAPKHRLNDSDNNPLYDEERQPYSATAEDTFDELLAGLTRRPDVAQSNVAQSNIARPHVAQSNVAPANVAPANVAPGNVASPNSASPNVASNEPTLARLPSVEEFHFDEVAARNMASKLAPNKKPRIKSRRPRYRSPHRDRWHLPDENDDRDEQNDGRDADNWDLPQTIAAPRRSVRGLFWSLCTSLLIVIGTSAAFGFVQPLNDLLPTRMAGFLSGLSGELGASLLNRAETSADIEMAGNTAASGPAPVSSEPRLASAAVARTVSTTTITAEVGQPANSGGSGIVVEQGEPPGATSEKAFELGATVLELGKIDGAEFATSKSAAALALAPSAAAAAPADAGNEGNSGKPLLQRSVKANPLQIANTTPAITPEPVASEPQSAMSSLSAAQIDRLLVRGEELLQNGDIASARLLFLRVAAAGDRRGANGVAMTYDPRVYARLPVTGLTPDREQAEIWYRKAGVDSAFTTDSINAAETPKAQEARSAEWNADCARKYNSFEPSTGLYTANSGAKRQCQLP